MGSFSYANQTSSSQSSTQSNLVCTDPSLQQQGQGNAKSAPAALDKLGGSTSTPKAPVDLGAVRDGGSFVTAASAALDALIPGPGSYANLTIGGRIPIYTTGAMTAYLEPQLMLQAAKSDKGKLEVTLESILGIKAEASTSGGGWWPQFLAYFKAYAKGSLKIVGDSAREIFNEFMLTLRMVLEGACDAAGAPADIKQAMANGALAQETAGATVKGMDQDDGVTVAIGGGAEAGVKSSLGDAKAGADIEFSKSIGNSDGDAVPEVTSKTSVSLKGEMEIKKLWGMKFAPGLTFVFQNGRLTQWYFSLSGTKEMTLESFSAVALMGADWAQDFVHSMANMLVLAGKKDKTVAQAANLVSGIAVGPEALKYTAFGESLKSAAKLPDFKTKMGMAVEFSVGGQVGWTQGKGLDMKVSLGSATSWTLGKDGETPLFITAKSGDTLVSLGYNGEDGGSAAT